MRKREMQTTAKELNRLLNPTPKIDPDGKKLKEQLIEAGSLVVNDDLDELNETTKRVLKELEVGPFEKEEEGDNDPNKLVEGKEVHEENPASLQQHTTPEEIDNESEEIDNEQEKTQANFDSPDENTSAPTQGQEKDETAITTEIYKEQNEDLETVLSRVKKLADLKTIVQEYDEFKKLRNKKKLDDYTGIAGTRELKAAMKKLAGIKDDSLASSDSGKKEKTQTKKYTRADALYSCLEEGGTRQKLTKRLDELYQENGGKANENGARAMLDMHLPILIKFGVVIQNNNKEYELA